MKIRSGICFILIIVLLCNIAFAETLTVSVSFDQYFAPPDDTDDPDSDTNIVYSATPEYIGLKKFQEAHPDCEIRIVVDAPLGDHPEADIYLLSGSLTDIHKALQSPNIQPIDAYIPEDLEQNCLCLDLLVNGNNELVAIPVYAWAFALYPNVEIAVQLPASEQTILPDSVKSWDNIYTYGARLKSEGFTPPVIAGLPYMSCQLLGLAQDTQSSFDSVEEQVTDLLALWKEMADEGILEVPKTFGSLSFEPSENSLLSFDHAYIFDIREALTGIKSDPPFYTIPLCGSSFQSPLRMETGMISSSCNNISLAMEFLSTFASMDNQMLFAHSGIIRSDLYELIKAEKTSNSEWYNEQKFWWGDLVSERVYASYYQTVSKGFIPSITDADLLLFSWDIANYLNDNMPITVIIDWLEKYYTQY